jgi:hypothetical protein
MGLLDEAIRDHLELKRRRGGDPGEIAREEREALEPVFPDEPRPAALDGEPQATMLDEAPPHGDPLADLDAPSDGPLAEAPPEALPDGNADEPSTIGQETAELDMQAVLDQDARLAEQQHVPTEDSSSAGGGVDDELDWEMPDRSADPPPEPLPGQERLSFE